jgi:hypothetical protein
LQRQKPFYLVANGLDYIVTAVNYGRKMFMRLATARKSSIVDFQKKKNLAEILNDFLSEKNQQRGFEGKNLQSKLKFCFLFI